MSRASIHIVVRSICCAKFKGVDPHKEEDDVVATTDPEPGDPQSTGSSSNS
jgi:hypothetical protein